MQKADFMPKVSEDLEPKCTELSRNLEKLSSSNNK